MVRVILGLLLLSLPVAVFLVAIAPTAIEYGLIV